MGRCNRQAASRFIGEFEGNLSDVLNLTKDVPRAPDDRLAGSRHMRQMFAAACKDIGPEFIFKQPNLFADSWLGGEETLLSRRDIEIVMGNLPNVSQLLKLHRLAPGFVPDQSPRHWKWA
jgi:hypothetical protein